MFTATETPRVYAVPLGNDFSKALYDGLRARFDRMQPHDVAGVEVLVNTRRMQRRLTALFHEGPAQLLPQIKLVTDLGEAADLSNFPPAISPLRRRLEVAQLVRALIKTDPTLASQHSAFALADSLVTLMSEMQGEGVKPDQIAALDVSDQSGHWQRALSFITLVQSYFDDGSAQDPEGRQRCVIQDLTSSWEKTPPTHPIIVAGSTGSRGTTAILMQAVAKLPQGAIIFPGVDTSMPKEVWDKLSYKDSDGGQVIKSEDHPQFRFKKLCDDLQICPTQSPLWNEFDPAQIGRAELISLALRPAPVTDQWIMDGPSLKHIEDATKGLSLIEAPTPRAEADAIAVRMRQAIEDNQVAALITPDRMLTRQVTAALDRWCINPDDSAGTPLHLTAPGRMLRHLADTLCEPITAEMLLILLRHPLANTGGEKRGAHILNTNALELELRRNGPPFPTPNSLKAWAVATADRHPERPEWVQWISETLLSFDPAKTQPLTDHVAQHIALAERLCAGPESSDTGELWQEAAGREALRIIKELSHHADAGGTISAEEYRQIIGSLLTTGEVRDRDKGDPRVLIWGTLEARVQTADLIILGGMNEGTWPEATPPDPWLNRPMRQQAKLLLPERRVGLSAHDFQQAVCAQQVVISRSIRSDEAETVPSRWVNRLQNLLTGLTEQGGPTLLKEMRKRGDIWLDLAESLSTPSQKIQPAPRPSPCPPRDARPKQLSVTQIKTLIRDPYAIYARKVLKLNALDPLNQSPDAPLRGIIVHDVLERFIKTGIDPADPNAADRLMGLADDVLRAHCPWPAMRALWRERIAHFVPHFLSEEQERSSFSANIDTEMRGELYFSQLDFTLTGTADRIDRADDGSVLIYDYKTGMPPSKKQQLNFDKQLLLEAAMAERGAFKPVGTARTREAVYIGLGSDLKNVKAPLEDSPPKDTLERFQGLIAKWMDPEQGYTSRRANETLTHEGDFDHLARYGEWDETNDPTKEDLS